MSSLIQSPDPILSSISTTLSFNSNITLGSSILTQLLPVPIHFIPTIGKPLSDDDEVTKLPSKKKPILSLSFVQSAIESVITKLTESILASDGFAFDIPSRCAANQLYVPELDRIVLKDKTSVRQYADIATENYKGAAGRRGGGPKKKSVSRSVKAGL